MRRTLTLVSLSALASGVFFALSPTTEETSFWLVFFAVLFGAVGGLTVELYLRLRARLGTFTAAVGLATLTGVLFGAIAYAVPECPGTTLTERCPVRYVGVWTVAGVLSPLTVGMLLLPLYLLVQLVLLVRAFRRGERSPALPQGLRSFLVRLGVLSAPRTQRPTGTAPARGTPRAPDQAAVDPASARARTGDPRAKRGPTPRRAKRSS